MASYQQAFGDIGGAVGDIFGAIGAGSEASSLQKAASYADLAGQITKASTRVQQMQEQRKIEQYTGAQMTAVAGAGFQESGTALDLLRSNAEQGALSKAVIGEQGGLQELSYSQQASAYRGEASAAKTAQKGGFLGAIISGIGAVASLF